MKSVIRVLWWIIERLYSFFSDNLALLTELLFVSSSREALLMQLRQQAVKQTPPAA